MEKQQNVLLVLGNGFDKSFGLATGYKEFLESEEFKKAYHDVLLNQPSAGLIQRLYQTKDLSNWVDAELEIRNYAISASESLKGNDYLVNKLRIEYIMLKEALSSYLKKCIASFSCNNDKSSSFFPFFKKVPNNSFDVISFNYTDTFSIIAKELTNTFNLPNSVFNIHGTLQNENIIFGIDESNDKTIVDDISFLEKSYHKNFNPKKVLELLKNSNEIYFFGVSFGETDSDYYGDFFFQLRANQTDKSIYISYFGEDNYQYIHNRIKKYSNNNVSYLKSRHTITFYDCISGKFSE